MDPTTGGAGGDFHPDLIGINYGLLITYTPIPFLSIQRESRRGLIQIIDTMGAKNNTPAD
jgi:hypothetical protein